MGFEQSEADPCLLRKRDEHGEVVLGIYVDDVVCIGDASAIEEMQEALEKKVSIKRLGGLHEYVGCTVERDADYFWFLQPRIIGKLEKRFGADVQKLRATTAPLPPGTHYGEPTKSEIQLSNDLQQRYRQGVGTLLYLVKHSRPDIANAVRELAKNMSCPTDATWKGMLRTINYVLNTRGSGVRTPLKGIRRN